MKLDPAIILLTRAERRRAASLLRCIADHSCEALHFTQRAADTKSENARYNFWEKANNHEDKLGEAIHSLANLLGVDIETRNIKE
jgi:hypothetical protein